MSTPGSSRRPSLASPSRRPKRKAADDTAGPSTSTGRSRDTSNSPFHPDSASSSTTPSPVKRSSVSSAPRRNSRQARTFQIADEFDQDQDAPYDEELDADGEYDEEYLDQDAPAEDDEQALDLTEEAGVDADAGPSNSASSTTPARQSARPKRSNAPNVSYYAVQPLPSLSDDEQDEQVTPSIRKRARKARLPPTSDVEIDDQDHNNAAAVLPHSRSRSRGTPTTARSTSKQPSGKAPRRPAEAEGFTKSAEPQLSEEAKQQAKAEKEAQDLQSRWTEEYFEIIEQLPLEVHRTFALMRELEGQMQVRVGTMVQNMTAYRDVRLQMQRLIDGGANTALGTEDSGSHRSSVGRGSEDEAENLLGGSQDGQTSRPQLTSRSAGDDGQGVEAIPVEDEGITDLLDKDARRELLRSISLAANESVKAAEEKMGLAATAYNWIDRHIRRLDADISKLESSILLGLRTGTEESRGAREALGLPVDGETDEAADAEVDDGQALADGVSAEAETAALTKAAGAANRAPGGVEAGERRSTRTTPKMGGQAQLMPSPRSSERAATRSRSRSASTSAVATAARQKTTSPVPPAANRITRKRKPKPLSPQKGGRRSIVTTTPTIISPTSQTPRPSAAVVGPDTSEMPFDPTEPTYCYCDQISFDEMVACDNDDCSLEWFHYSCVGLTRPPKKEWYCRFCAPAGWTGEGMAVPPNAKHKPVGFKKGVGIKA
ncbi:hypothetical protein PHSY_004390 [Pseudozyma hubeiensis SY62]|uniref:Chromatin modification-related protein n=1 Tax=Pseudozyma hubeiensis (strain SY62) TaxID=1305764 RepID=R9P639_PSEHS|nr:hypothetical protein PHSY_004390 [Pseudozyma hubeiensis SY62]GAC96806.1 hypothetical protein PHSY_004390 [Pseudozyma hubeiensis SY62]